MEISDLNTAVACNNGVDILIELPNGDPSDIVIRIVGKDSDQYKKFTRSSMNKRMQQQLKRGAKRLDAEDLERDEISLLATCTTGWDNIVLDKEPYEFSEQNAKKLYSEWGWIKDQVKEAMESYDDFLSKSNKS